MKETTIFVAKLERTNLIFKETMSVKGANKGSQQPNEWEKIDQAVMDSGQFVDKHMNKIIAAIAVVVVVVCGYLAYDNFIAGPKLEQAQNAMYRGQQYFEAGRDSVALHGDGNGYIGFEGVIKEYGSTNAGNTAKLYAGICYARMGDYEKALDYVKSFNAKDEILQYLAQGTIGDCLVNLGKSEEAISHFLNAAKGVDNMVQSPIMYKKAGLVYRELKQYDKVIETFSLIKNNYMSSPLAQEADKYIEEAKALQGGN